MNDQPQVMAQRIRRLKQSIPNQFLLVLTAMLTVSMACILSDIAQNIDTSPTVCTETFVVTETFDLNDGMCNSQCTLREAVIAANTCPGPNTVELGPGVHMLTFDGEGDELGDIDIKSDMVIRGASAQETIVQASDTWTDRIFEVQPAGQNQPSNVTIQNLTVTGGNLRSGEGGGILNWGSAVLDLEGVVIDGNRAINGSGIANLGALNIQTSQILNNSAYLSETIYPSCGGGIHNDWMLSLTGSLVSENEAEAGSGICNTARGTTFIANSEVRNNGDRLYGITEKGGGVYSEGRLRVIGTVFSENFGRLGGGLYLYHTDPSHGATLTGVTVQGNQSEPLNNEFVGGGGIAHFSGPLDIEDSTIRGNETFGDGGGILVSLAEEDLFGILPASVTINNSSIVENLARGIAGTGRAGEDATFAGRGGGLYSTIIGPGEITVNYENVTLSGNFAQTGGNAVFIQNGDHAFRNVTVAINDGNRGAIMMLRGELRTANSLFVMNRPWNCDIRGGRFTSQGYNIDSRNLCGFDHPTDSSLYYADSIVIPELTDVNGQLVHILLANTIAVDRIENPSVTCPANDQRGMVRPQGTFCDVGAYESDLTLTSLEGDTLEPVTVTPSAEPSTVNTDTLCYEGPGAPYSVVSALNEAAQVQILGVGAEEGWLVIDNPRFSGVNCWVDLDDIDLAPNLDLTVLALFPVPEPPAATATLPPVAPSAPTNLVISEEVCLGQTYSVSLSWSDNADNEQGFNLYRQLDTGGQPIELIATLGANTASYTDNPPQGGPYNYYIEAFNDAGASPPSITVTDGGCLL